METIQGQARFDSRGKVIPLSFDWAGKRYVVDSYGRRWIGKDGEHILVMDIGGKAFHLIYDRENDRWWLRSPRELPKHRQV